MKRSSRRDYETLSYEEGRWREDGRLQNMERKQSHTIKKGGKKIFYGGTLFGTGGKICS